MSAIDRDRTDAGLSKLPPIKPARNTRGARVLSIEAHERGECIDGWYGPEDNPSPCLVCRPHLVLRIDGWRVSTKKEQDHK